jgi:hypothetical protein
MQRILTLVLCFHWMAVFAVLASLAAFDGGTGIPESLGAMGIVATGGFGRLPGALALSTALGVGFGLVAVLFLWAVAGMILGGREARSETDGTTRLAFGAAVVMLTLVFVGCALQPVSGHFHAIAIEIAALAGSYLVFAVEQRLGAGMGGQVGDELSAAARVMALRAVHGTLLARLTGRTAEKAGH